MSRFREKPEGDQIRISLDSGAHADSRHDVILEASDLGFASKSEWDDASDQKKLEAVQEYFYGNGFPEWSWDDAASAL